MHPLVGSTLPDGVYELLPGTVSGLPDTQPPQAGVPKDQGLSSIPVAEQVKGKHRYTTLNFDI
jgi:hypothetical protein